jgi:hypothetical protein
METTRKHSIGKNHIQNSMIFYQIFKNFTALIGKSNSPSFEIKYEINVSVC